MHTNRTCIGLLTGAALLMGTLTAHGHHSFSAQYDSAKPVDMKGTVTKVEWTTPHARFYIDVAVAPGKVENWNFEMASPNVLSRNGWKKNTLEIGTVVTVAGFMARVGERMAIAGAITGQDGKPLFASAQADLAR